MKFIVAQIAFSIQKMKNRVQEKKGEMIEMGLLKEKHKI